MAPRSLPSEGGLPAACSRRDAAVDPGEYRRVMSRHPTGVVIVTAVPPGGPATAMTIGTFASVSLDPPLVGFFPSKTSSSWAQFRGARAFCVNILSTRQAPLCAAVSAAPTDKLADVRWRPAPSGSPIIEGVAAWIDCELLDIGDAGDHWFVTGLVRSLAVESDGPPLVFAHGRFGSIECLPSDDLPLLSRLRLADTVRPIMEDLSKVTGLECLASTALGSELLVLAETRPTSRGAGPTRVGRRVPFTAPVGAALAAWIEPRPPDHWFAPDTGDSRWHRELEMIRTRGYHVGLGNDGYAALEDALVPVPGATRPQIVQLRDSVETTTGIQTDEEYEVRTMSAPVFTGRRDIVLQFSLYGFPHCTPGREILEHGRLLRDAANAATASLRAAARTDGESAEQANLGGKDADRPSESLSNSCS